MYKCVVNLCWIMIWQVHASTYMHMHSHTYTNISTLLMCAVGETRVGCKFIAVYVYACCLQIEGLSISPTLRNIVCYVYVYV